MPPRPPLERLSVRPNPEAWGDDELVSLAEAVGLFFPLGPLTTESLRVARRRGELACVEVCGRTFTTPRAIRAMSTPSLGSVNAAVEGVGTADLGAAWHSLQRRLSKR